MNYKISFTPKEKAILAVLFKKDMQIDTLPKIQDEISRNHSIKSDQNMYKFLRWLVTISILKVTKYTNYSRSIVDGEKIENGKKYIVYEVDKEKISEFWEQTWEYWFSRETKKFREKNGLFDDLKKDFSGLDIG